MKYLMVSSVFVLFILAPSLALMNPGDGHPQEGSVGSQSIRVNALGSMISIRDNNVLSEWDGILDYENGLLAAKLFSKMACVLTKMDKAVFPTLDDISKALDHQVLHWLLIRIPALKSNFSPSWDSPSVGRSLGSEPPGPPRGERTCLDGAADLNLELRDPAPLCQREAVHFRPPPSFFPLKIQLCNLKAGYTSSVWLRAIKFLASLVQQMSPPCLRSESLDPCDMQSAAYDTNPVPRRTRLSYHVSFPGAFLWGIP
uniref:Gastrokine 3 n=1 Tax=Sus scrofa TaxID=9823 RepID=A0A8D1MFS1_PIG